MISIQTLKKKAEQEKVNLTIQKAALETQKSQLIDSNRSGNLSIAQSQKNRREIELINSALRDSQSIIDSTDENYKDLLNSNNKDKNKDKTLKFIQDIATASLNLTKEACKENNGTYYNLSKSQEIALVDKAKTNKMNSFFFVCRKKIKEVYLENLKLLIEILNKLNETPLINNATLNIISNDAKTIIDKMYTLCQYYYIYAIISLLNADITTEEKTKKDFFKKDIKEFV
jgi:hypothetical protein